MTDLHIILKECSNHAERLLDIQMFLNSGSCPTHLTSLMNEHSLDLIEKLKTQLYFANHLPNESERTIVEARLMDIIK